MSVGGSSGGKGGGNIYDASSNALNTAGNMYAQPGLSGVNQNTTYNPYTTGTSTYNPANMNAASYNANLMNGATYDPTQIGNIANQAMNNFMNPYINQVIGNATTDINRAAAQQQAANQANASNVGAFGGSRAGVVEALTNSEAQKNIGDMSAAYRAQGFNDAIANQMAQSQFNANAMNTAGQFNAGNQQQANLMNQQALNTAGQYNAGNRQAANAANQAAANTAGQFNANARNTTAANNQAAINNAGQFNIQSGQNWQQLVNADQMARAAGLQGLGNQAFDIGNTITGQQAQQGALQQQLIQAILGGAASQYDQFMNRPQDLLSMQLQALGMNPMSGTGTTTQQYKPGLLDYLSLGGQVGGSYLSGKGG